MMADQPYDLAIVGAGQAGCTLAGKIAENGVNPTTGEPLKIAIFDRGAYLYHGRIKALAEAARESGLSF